MIHTAQYSGLEYTGKDGRISKKPLTDELRTTPREVPKFKPLELKGRAWEDVFAKIADHRQIKSWAWSETTKNGG